MDFFHLLFFLSNGRCYLDSARKCKVSLFQILKYLDFLHIALLVNNSPGRFQDMFSPPAVKIFNALNVHN